MVKYTQSQRRPVTAQGVTSIISSVLEAKDMADAHKRQHTLRPEVCALLLAARRVVQVFEALCPHPPTTVRRIHIGTITRRWSILGISLRTYACTARSICRSILLLLRPYSYCTRISDMAASVPATTYEPVLSRQSTWLAAGIGLK